MSDAHWIKICAYPAQGHAEHPNQMFFRNNQSNPTISCIFNLSVNRFTLLNCNFKNSLILQNLLGAFEFFQFFPNFESINFLKI